MPRGGVGAQAAPQRAYNRPTVPNRVRIPHPPLLLWLALPAAGLLAASPAAAAPLAALGTTEFHAVIDGTQAHPPHVSNAQGVGLFTLNAAHTELTYTITFDPWVDDEIFSHIHIDAAANGGQDAILFDLPNGNPKVGFVKIDQPLVLEALFDGFLYVNVHTQQYRQGEIAGYLRPGTPAVAASWGRIKALFR